MEAERSIFYWSYLPQVPSEGYRVRLASAHPAARPAAAAGGGKECDVVEEVRPAALEASAHWTPGAWGPCRVAVPCPRDCEVGDWSEWGACQPTDGCPLFPVQQLTTTGYSVRRRRVISAASGGGAPCPPLEEKRACSTPRCASWKALPWGPCVLGTGAPARSERCRIACSGDCVVSAWAAWPPCPSSCAVPSRPTPARTRRRHVLAHAAPDGWPCPSEDQLIQNETCNTHACATYSWLATPWGPCERRRQDFIPANNYTDFLDGEPYIEGDDEEPCVEEGEMARDVMCVQNNADVVREALCHRGCKVEAWMPWSTCPNTCDPGKQTRVRTVHGGPSCGPRQETRDCPVPSSCRSRAVTWVAEPDIPNCVCKNVALELLPSDSDCILASGLECGEGRALRAARCMVAGRDVPMDVCKKYHPLTGPQRVREASTDGYSYDMEFSGLLRGPCSVRCARDCAAGPWAQWGPCAAEPGSRAAFRFRTREVIEEGSAGGRECGATLQRATCAVSEPRWALGEWSVCAPQRALCGRAIINRTVTGRECCATLQRATCAVSEPRWALGEWSVCAPRRALCGRAIINRTVTRKGMLCDVTARDLRGVRAAVGSRRVVSVRAATGPLRQSHHWQTKWGGRRDRTRVVLRPAEDGGAACPQLVAAEPCSPHLYSWHVCLFAGGSPCGEGIKKRAVRCLRSDGIFVNDSFCPNSTAIEPRESWCYVPCGVDCELGEWSPWDTTACSCGDTSSARHMRRTRQHLTSAVWPGRACPATEQRAPCPREPCLRLVARPSLACRVRTTSEKETYACGWGVKLSHARCELTSVEEDTSDAHLEPWRCATVLPGRIVTPPLHYQIPDLLAIEPHEDKPRRAWADKDVYHDGYLEGGVSLLAVVWTATIVLSLYGAFMLYRGFIRAKVSTNHLLLTIFIKLFTYSVRTN
ncbi:Thrombospondin type-1 domain-containing protein 7B-like protein [Operophtera brumata]|uniref:Thrombospondin type-1 domain-containing protein 7B-like protein n=1 Tax=Operophtera brumata TaxID=104452 RepID=A0A0L7LJ01_OPEBR|nr:Thrombospondin type-1 domain-containing protein 7B-like protein [Operophtera brumata]